MIYLSKKNKEVKKMADKKQSRRRNNNQDDDFNPKFRKVRKKLCPLCSDKNFELDYKNADQLKKFINELTCIIYCLLINMNAGLDNQFYTDAYNEIINLYF